MISAEFFCSFLSIVVFVHESLTTPIGLCSSRRLYRIMFFAELHGTRDFAAVVSEMHASNSSLQVLIQRWRVMPCGTPEHARKAGYRDVCPTPLQRCVR